MTRELDIIKEKASSLFRPRRFALTAGGGVFYQQQGENVMNQLSEPLVISDLSIAERILVVEQVWDSIAAEQASLSITSAQQEELDRRLCAHRESTSESASWEETKDHLLETTRRHFGHL